MIRAFYLADTSAFVRLDKPRVAAVVAEHVAEGRIALCTPVAFELGFSARNAADHALIMNRIESFEWVSITEDDHQQALDTQFLLAGRGHHRAVSFVDALVAATASRHDLTVLHYDRDFDLMADVTGQPTQWIVDRGTADQP